MSRRYPDEYRDDERTVAIVRRASPHPVAYLQCPEEIRGERCTHGVVRCWSCDACGCWGTPIPDAPCPLQLFTLENRCLECGHHAVMNRELKLSAMWLKNLKDDLES
ncbi:MAG: hypothetical protein NXI30_06480 [bacterium]|nr:hypothetical protein [bacterium]